MIRLQDFRDRYPHVKLPAWLDTDDNVEIGLPSKYATVETAAWACAILTIMGVDVDGCKPAVEDRACELMSEFLRGESG